MRTEPSGRPPRYDFGLSAADEARAIALHERSIVFDWLSQHVGGSNIFEHFPTELQVEFRAGLADISDGWIAYRKAVFWPYEMSLQGRSDLIRDWYLASGLNCGTWSVPVHDGGVSQLREAEAIKARYERLPWLRFVTRAAEIRQAKRDGLIAFYGHWQPTVPLPRNLKAIDQAYAKGLRSLMLTYNRMDNVGVGCTERVDAGLSMYGLDVLRHCEQLGLMVDVSHCGHLTTMDACRHAKRPVNANHTCARSLSDVARGKHDDAIKAVADTGGIIGVVAVPFFISATRKPAIEAMLDHIDYIANLVGWQHVSLGTDWPNQVPDDVQAKVLGGIQGEIGFRPEDRYDVTDRVIGFDDYRDLPNITRGLVKRGYSDEQVQGILGENALRVFAEICG